MLTTRPLPGWTGRFFHSENMTFGWWEIEAGAIPVFEHQHPQEEVWYVIEGEIAVTIEGVEHVVGPGMAAAVPSGVLHSATPLGAGRVLVVDYPVRHTVPAIR